MNGYYAEVRRLTGIGLVLAGLSGGALVFYTDTPGINLPGLLALAAAAIILGAVALAGPWQRVDRSWFLVVTLAALGIIVGAMVFGGGSRGSAHLFLLGIVVVSAAYYPTSITIGIALLAVVAHVAVHQAELLQRVPTAVLAQAILVGLLTYITHVLFLRLIGESERLRTNDYQLQLALETAGMGTWEMDLRRQELFWSANAARLLGLESSGGPMRWLAFLDRVHHDDRARLERSLLGLQAGNDDYQIEFRIVWRSGTVRWIEARARVVAAPGGDGTRLIGVVSDVTDRKEEEQVLVHRTLHDPLTGLPNRTLFYDRLQTAIIECRRDRLPLAVLLLDLDGFKELNDTHGHAKGDVALAQIAQRLRRAVRSTDTIGRIGGDEFAMVLPGANRSAAARAAAAVLRQLDAPIDIDDLAIVVGASIGIALFPEHGADPQALLDRADRAMYEAKRDPAGAHIRIAE